MIDPPEIIARRLRALRVALKEPVQKEFARKLGIEKNTYNAYERGTRPLTFETACLIRAKYGIPVDWLFWGDKGKVSRDILTEIDIKTSATERKPKRAGAR